MLIGDSDFIPGFALQRRWWAASEKLPDLLKASDSSRFWHKMAQNRTAFGDCRFESEVPQVYRFAARRGKKV